jgi:hypothetical protein
MRSGGNGLATFAEKIKQSDESIPSSGMPAVASGPLCVPKTISEFIR